MITKTELDGSMVVVDLDWDTDDFTVSMLEKHLQIVYPGAEMIENSVHNIHRSLVVIQFVNNEDAIRFHLTHNP